MHQPPTAGIMSVSGVGMKVMNLGSKTQYSISNAHNPLRLNRTAAIEVDRKHF